MPIYSWTEYVEDEYKGYVMNDLDPDEFYLTLINNSTTPKYLYSKYEDCVGCPYFYRTSLSAGYNSTLTESSERHKLYRVMDEIVEISPVQTEENVMCEIDHDFGEFGVFNLRINERDCSVQTVKEPVDIYFPLLTIVFIFATIYCVVYALCYLYDRYWAKKPNTSQTDNKENKKERVMSLDTFRGISIVLMIFVNYGAGGYSILDHEIWNGLHIADVVFPSFLWIMGVCIPISVNSMFKKGQSKKDSLLQITKRSCILFGIGIFLGSGPNLATLRIFGVLQRFGICYFVVASICVLMYSDGYFPLNSQDKFLDFLRIAKEWLVIGGILVSHTLITFFVADENCPRGYLGPGGYHENASHFYCTGGAAGYIDKIILGDHRYHHPTFQEVYRTPGPFDPEGILGCLTSIVQVFFGVQAGVTMLTYKNKYARLLRWVIWGVTTGLIGGGLCGFTKDDGVIPINKNLWSISFVLVTTSIAFLLLAVLFYVVDVKKWWTGRPFLFAGMNSILMYVGHSMVGSNFPVHWIADAHQTHFLQMFENTWATNAWVLVAYWLFRVKCFWSV